MPEFATELSFEKPGTLSLCKLSGEPRRYPVLGQATLVIVPGSSPFLFSFAEYSLPLVFKFLKIF